VADEYFDSPVIVGFFQSQTLLLRKPFLLGTNCSVGTRGGRLHGTPVWEYVLQTLIYQRRVEMIHLAAIWNCIGRATNFHSNTHDL